VKSKVNVKVAWAQRALMSNKLEPPAKTRTATALLRLAQHDPAVAAAALAPVLPRGWLARAFLLEAMARDELGDPDAAGRALERALDLTEPDGMISLDLLERHARQGATMAISNIVLVHGGFVDGSGWQGVYDQLTADGYRVAVVQNPTLSLDGDVAATHQILDGLDGPAVLVGHSYGGVVITAAGNHPNVAALAYIAAFAPDKGESVSSLIADPPPGAPVPPILPPNNGFLFLDRDKFAASFAADVPAKLAAFMADSQVPWGVDALGGTPAEPAWRTKPSWYLVATDDHMIPPPAQRAMAERAGATVSETPGSHAVYVSRPAVVAAVIAQAAQGLNGQA
jgi:pimeloyl-ACP methyl ester carboxylesterase